MLLIIAHHYVVNSGLMAADGPIYGAPLSAPSLFLLFLGAWGKTGINSFVLMTGYFMCTSRIKAKKFARLLGEIMFYRVAFGLVFWLTGYESFTLRGLLDVLFPVRSVTQDFVDCYLLFYLCIPFLNILLRGMTEKQHILLLALLGVIYVFFGTAKFLGVSMNYVSWFAVLYLLAAYIRLYPKRIFEKHGLWGWLTLASAAAAMGSVVVCAWLGQVLGKHDAYYFVVDSNTLLAVTTALCAFLFFKGLRVRQSRFINAVAASTFGVLLIHAHSDAMRRWLWRDTLNNVGMYGRPMMVPHAFGSVLGVFILCTALDMLRIRLLERPVFRHWDRLWGPLERRYRRFEARVAARIKASRL